MAFPKSHGSWILIPLWLVVNSGFLACSPQDIEWRGHPEPDKRAALGIQDKHCQVLMEQAWDIYQIEDSILERASKKEEWEFNSDGQLVHYQKWQGAMRIQELRYKLNDRGQLVSTEDFEEEGQLKGASTITYFADGQLAEIQRFNGRRRLKERCQYNYDDAGRIASIHNLFWREGEETPAGQDLHTYKYASDDTYQIVTTIDERYERTEYYVAGHLDSIVNESGSKIKNHYNSNNQLVGEESFDEAGNSSHKVEYIYDERGRQTLRVKYGNGRNSPSSTRTTYDSLGNVASEEDRYNAGLSDERMETTLREYRYTDYDSLGNWHTAAEQQNGVLVRKRTRAFKPF